MQVHETHPEVGMPLCCRGVQSAGSVAIAASVLHMTLYMLVRVQCLVGTATSCMRTVYAVRKVQAATEKE